MNSMLRILAFALITSIPVLGTYAQGTITWGTNSPTDSTGFNEGNSSLIRPYRGDSSRYQQVYAADDFVSTLAAGGVWLQRLLFRTDGNGFAFSGTASNLDVRLSTIGNGLDSLSPVFANNPGANETVVLGPANQIVSGVFVPRVNAAQEWSVIINFATPFLYRPADGNLLLDIRMTGGVGLGAQLDAWNRAGDSVSSVSGFYGDTSGALSTIGLATRFEGTLVPESSAYALFTLGAAAILLLRKKRESFCLDGHHQKPATR